MADTNDPSSKTPAPTDTSATNASAADQSAEIQQPKYKPSPVTDENGALAEFRRLLTSLPAQTALGATTGEIVKAHEALTDYPTESLELLLDGGITVFCGKARNFEAAQQPSEESRAIERKRLDQISKLLPLLEDQFFHRVMDMINPEKVDDPQTSAQAWLERCAAQRDRLTASIMKLMLCGGIAEELANALEATSKQYGSAVTMQFAANATASPAPSVKSNQSTTDPTQPVSGTAAPATSAEARARSSPMFQSTPVYTMQGGIPMPAYMGPYGQWHTGQTPMTLQGVSSILNAGTATGTPAQPPALNQQNATAPTDASADNLASIRDRLATLEATDTSTLTAEGMQMYKDQYKLLTMMERRHSSSGERERKEKDQRRPKLTLTAGKDVAFSGRRNEKYEGDFDQFLTRLRLINPNANADDFLAVIVRSLSGPAQDFFDAMKPEVQNDFEKLKKEFQLYFRKIDDTEAIREWHACQMQPTDGVDYFHHHVFARKLADYLSQTGAEYPDQTKKLEFFNKLTPSLQERMTYQHGSRLKDANVSFAEYLNLAVQADDDLKRGAERRQQEFTAMARQCGLKGGFQVAPDNRASGQADQGKRNNLSWPSRGGFKSGFRRGGFGQKQDDTRRSTFKQAVMNSWKTRNTVPAKQDSSGALRQNNTWNTDPKLCFGCGKRGHFNKNCPNNAKPQPQPKQAQSPTDTSTPQQQQTGSGFQKGNFQQKQPFRQYSAQQSTNRSGMTKVNRFMVCPVNAEWIDEHGVTHYGDEETGNSSTECFNIDDQGQIYVNEDTGMDFEETFEQNDGSPQENDEGADQGSDQTETPTEEEGDKCYRVIAMNRDVAGGSHSFFGPRDDDDEGGEHATTSQVSQEQEEGTREENHRSFEARALEELLVEATKQTSLRIACWKRTNRLWWTRQEEKMTANGNQPEDVDGWLTKCMTELSIGQATGPMQDWPTPGLNMGTFMREFATDPREALERLEQARAGLADKKETFRNYAEKIDKLWEEDEAYNAQYRDWPSFPLIFGRAIVQDPLFDSGSKRSFISLKALMSMVAADEECARAFLMMRKCGETVVSIGPYRDCEIIGKVLMPCKLPSKTVMIEFRVMKLYQSNLMFIGMNGLRAMDMYLNSKELGNCNFIKGPRKDEERRLMKKWMWEIERVLEQEQESPAAPAKETHSIGTQTEDSDKETPRSTDEDFSKDMKP